MTSSPPQQAAEFRGKTLTPVSPKPVHYPSPSNIPILEKQMDPMFNDSSLQLDLSASYQSVMQPEKAPSNTSSADSLYAEQTGPSSHQINAEFAAGEGGSGEYPGSFTFGNGEGTDNQDTSSIKNFSQNFTQAQGSTAGAPREAASALAHVEGVSVPSYDPTSLLDPAHAAAQFQPNPLSTANLSAQDAAQIPALDSALDGGVNFQTLLDNLSPSIASIAQSRSDAVAASFGAQNSTSSNGRSPISTLPSHPNLPPRPPPQEKPATHPNYAPEDDIRSYHPHSQKTPAASYRAQSGLPPLMTSGTHSATPSNGLPHSSFQQHTPVSTTQGAQGAPAAQGAQSPNTPAYRQREPVERHPEREDEDAPWGPEINKIYEDFLREERIYVTEGQWDKFPPNSRLFIGNLPTEKVTKRDLFHIFHKHGKLAQISIKQAYGFVQFLDANSCYHALQTEQGTSLRGRKIHLEISKPQKSTRGGEKEPNARGGRRRSRSPDYARGGTASAPRGVDRYTSGGAAAGGSPRERDFRRMRDDYRPGRSPSPRAYRGGRGRDRSRDRYDGRRRSRSRSSYGRDRYRSLSPRRETDDDLPLPRRAPKDVPDVQIIVLDDLDRNFIAWVEKGFTDRGVRCNVLILSPRLSEEAVVRRQILEGVIAVSSLQIPAQQSGTIPLRIFDRRGGVDNVKFEDYENLPPNICAELVIRAKQTHTAPVHNYGVPPTYGIPPTQYALPPNHQTPAQQTPAANQNLSSLISSLDGAGLQQLLGAMQQPSQQPQTPATGLTPDLAKLLGTPTTPSHGQAYSQPQSATSNAANPYAALSANPGLASLIGAPGTAGTPQQQHMTSVGAAPPGAQGAPGQPDMQEIMAQLAKYRR